MSNERTEKAKSVAKRTLKIINLLEEGHTPQEVVKKTGANRQLVDYYNIMVNEVGSSAKE